MTTEALPEPSRDGRPVSPAWPDATLGEVTGTPPSALTVTSETFEDLVLIGLRGELDVYTCPAFREHVRRYDPAEVQLAVDLAGVRLLDSAGLGGLVSLRNEVHRRGRRLGLVCPERDLARLFWVTGLRPAFAFGESLAALRVALGVGPAQPMGGPDARQR